MAKGQFTFPSGNLYVGGFSLTTGDFEGNGKMTTENETIQGDWKESKLNGQATRRTHSGDIYNGQWTNGMLNGEGEYITADSTYKG
jgi:hypothetical protein